MLAIYVPKYIASKYIRQKLIELLVQMDESTTIVGNFSTLYQKWQIQKAGNE
jgi:hypothetical protein